MPPGTGDWRPRAFALAACLGIVAACRPAGGEAGGDAGQAAEARPTVAASSEDNGPVSAPDDAYQLIDSLQGVWASGEDGAAETVFMLAHVVDHEMDMSRNGVGLDLGSTGVDARKGNATFRFRGSQTGERVTFAKVRTEGDGERLGLRVTYADGSQDDLAFVRPLEERDIAELERVNYERAPLQTAVGRDSRTFPSTAVDCTTNADAHARRVCADAGLHALDLRLSQRFGQLHDAGADIHDSRAAALKQLRGCGNAGCLAPAYAAWLAYLQDFDKTR